MTTIEMPPTVKDLRNFGLITGSISASLFGLLLPVCFGRNIPLWPWVIGTLLCAWGVILPASLKPVYHVWTAIGNVLGWVNTRIILGLIFFLVIFPIGLVMKLVGKNPLSRIIDVNKESYRIHCTVPEKTHVERPF